MEEIRVKFGRDIDASELLTPVSRESLDIQEIMRIHSIELNLLWDVMLDILSNQFIRYATEYGLSQWEGILDLPSGGSFEERRLRVLKELMGLRPYTLESFQNMLNGMYGEGAVKLNLVNDKSALWFDMSAYAVYKQKEIYDFAEVIVPKNLILMFKNIKTIQGALYIGGVVDFKKIIHIDADMGFNIEPLKGTPYIGGHVSMKNVNIKI